MCYLCIHMQKINGVGDVIELITRYTGIKWVVNKASKLLNIDCGCDARKEKINVKLPFNNNGR